MRILLVEDEPSAATMLAKGLREEAYAVDVAPDGETALAQAFDNDYDLIVLDIVLPGKDGFRVCRCVALYDCEPREQEFKPVPAFLPKRASTFLNVFIGRIERRRHKVRRTASCTTALTHRRRKLLAFTVRLPEFW